jgi:iron complex transport system substrate-binding protein
MTDRPESSCDRRQWLALASALSCGLFASMASGAALAAGGQPQRVVSIGGALTEVIYALGAQSVLVGVDTTSLYPDEAQRLPSVGYARTLSAEGLMALQPTMIVATEDAGPPAVLRQVEAAHIPLQVLPAQHRFEGVLDRTRRLGELLERQAAAQALVDRLNTHWKASLATVERLHQSRSTPRALFIMSMGMNQMRIAGQDTAADAMLRYARVTNALQGVSGYRNLTPEAVIAAAPDVILTTDQAVQAMGGVQAVLQLPGLAMTPAGRSRRVVSMETMELLGFGPRLPQALSRLAGLLYA